MPPLLFPQYRTGTTSCLMRVIPIQLLSGGYGFALPAGTRVSVLRELDTAIVQLSERSILAKLESSYFVDNCTVDLEGKVVRADAVESHTITELSGLFILLGVFMVGAVLIRCLRVYW